MLQNCCLHCRSDEPAGTCQLQGWGDGCVKRQCIWCGSELLLTADIQPSPLAMAAVIWHACKTLRSSTCDINQIEHRESLLLVCQIN